MGLVNAVMLMSRAVKEGALGTRERLALFHGSSVSAQEALEMKMAALK